ncbi:MAG TPA: pilus assembly protein N-terminal domain-containing protein [Steroidobacter sp.]|uniref:type II and III secretion system protein family protein n=1 Tax=Steroidobacter sp. TaxID=1978227 RepID=UPI002ED9573D
MTARQSSNFNSASRFNRTIRLVAAFCCVLAAGAANSQTPETPTVESERVAPPTLTVARPIAAGRAPLSVVQGQTLLLRFPNVKRVVAGNGDLLDVKVFEDTDEVLVLALKEGVTDLRLWARDGHSETHVVRIVAMAQPAPIVAPLQPESTILIKAKFLEVKREVLRDIGVDWADVAQGPIFGTVQELETNPFFRVIPGNGSSAADLGEALPPFNIGTGNNYFGLTTVVDSLIRLLVNNGDARLLAEPTLTCINGGVADFLAGGELPIPIVDNDGRVDVQFKEFGIILNIEPQANDDGLIRTKVNVEVSSVDRSIAVLGIPGFATRKTKTEMNVQSGQTMVVGGLFSSDDAKNVTKVPGLGSVPIIGELFKSRNFRSGQTELVVLVSPQIIVAESPAVREARQQFDDLKSKSDEALKFKLKD